MSDITAKAYHDINVKNLQSVVALINELVKKVDSLEKQVATQELNIATMQGTIRNQQVQIAVLHGKWMGTGATSQ
jgi:peptidoglycan hydrolase CwlO-like protein